MSTSPLPVDAVPALPVTKRRADAMVHLWEHRVQYHRVTREFRFLGDSVADMKLAHQHQAEFLRLGLSRHDAPFHDGWVHVELTDAGAALFELWQRAERREDTLPAEALPVLPYTEDRAELFRLVDDGCVRHNIVGDEFLRRDLGTSVPTHSLDHALLTEYVELGLVEPHPQDSTPALLLVTDAGQALRTLWKRNHS